MSKDRGPFRNLREDRPLQAIVRRSGIPLHTPLSHSAKIPQQSRNLVHAAEAGKCLPMGCWDILPYLRTVRRQGLSGILIDARQRAGKDLSLLPVSGQDPYTRRRSWAGHRHFPRGEARPIGAGRQS